MHLNNTLSTLGYIIGCILFSGVTICMAQIDGLNRFKNDISKSARGGTIEIYFNSILGEPPASPPKEAIFKEFRHKLVVGEARIESPQVRELIESLERHTTCKGRRIWTKWAFVMRDTTGEAVFVAFVDPWIKYGLIDEKTVEFDAHLTAWIRKYLAAAFELERGDWKEPVMDDKKRP
jgi:hypothetical protein